MNQRNKRIAFNQVIKNAGISEGQFDFYRRTFAARAFPYRWKPDDDHKTRWIQKNWILSPSTIARHLAEEYLIATFGSDKIDYFVIDLDRGADEHEFRERVEKIKAVFPYGVPIQSSFSGKGIHYYQFLDDSHDLTDILALAKARLHRHGIELRPGYVELFPQTNGALRAPFGQGSFIVDTDDFTRLTTTKYEDIYFIQNQVDRVPLEQVFDDDDYDELSKMAVGSKKRSKGQFSHKYSHTDNNIIVSSVSIFNNPYIPECNWYLENGIQELGTRNDIQKDLIYFLMKIKGLSEEETYDVMEAWYYSLNNRNSLEWNENPNAVFGQTEAQIRWTAKRPDIHKAWHGLSSTEVFRVLQLNLDFKSSWFLFDLCKFLKTHADRDGYAFISQHLLYAMNGCSHRNYQKRIALAISAGFIEFESKHVPPLSENESGTATKYRTSLKFDMNEMKSIYFPSEAAAILGEDEFVRRWGRYFWDKYIKGASTNDRDDSVDLAA